MATTTTIGMRVADPLLKRIDGLRGERPGSRNRAEVTREAVLRGLVLLEAERLVERTERAVAQLCGAGDTRPDAA